MSEQPLQPEAPNETETEEHTEEYDEETNALLEEWAQEGGNNTRKRRSRQHIFEQRRPYPGFQFTESIRYQHIHNLVACVRHYEAIRDDASLAAVLATLLQSEHPENLKVKWQFRNQQAHARLCEVLMCAYHLFRRHSSSSSTTTITNKTSGEKVGEEGLDTSKKTVHKIGQTSHGQHTTIAAAVAAATSTSGVRA